MRSYDDYMRILKLWEQGVSKLKISKTLNIPRRTIRDVIARFETSDKLQNYIDTVVSSENVEIATQVLALWEEGNSKADIRRITGYSKYLISACIEQFRSLAQLQSFIDEYGKIASIRMYTADGHRKVRTAKYTNEELTQAVAGSISIRETLTKLGVKPSGGNYETIKRRIAELDLDTSHFRGLGWLRGQRNIHTVKQSLDDILVRKSTYKNTNSLKRRLLSEGIFEPVCSSCGLDTWLDQPIPLELDHINGERRDNRLENLRLLCPNCHALTETYRGKNINLETSTPVVDTISP